MTTVSLPQIDGQNLLTHSSTICFQSCPRKYQLRYVKGWSRERESTPLRVGSAYHLGLDLLAQGKTMDETIAAIRLEYANVPEWATDDDAIREWEYERVTVEELVSAYVWYHTASSPVEYIASEKSFRLPLVNPETGSRSTVKDMAGKIDKIIRLADGRLAVMEHKTTSDDIAPDADYWARLRVDHQISRYFLAARADGYDLQTVLYDVCRKPAIRPTDVPLVDENGVKIVNDSSGQRVKTKDGKKWRESADTAQGYVLQTRPMTPEDWGDKLRADIQEKPDRYFARQEIPRLESDLEEYKHDAWAQHQAIMQCERTGHFPRNTNSCISPYKCEFFEPCTQGYGGTTPPSGFRRVDDVHPEL